MLVPIVPRYRLRCSVIRTPHLYPYMKTDVTYFSLTTGLPFPHPFRRSVRFYICISHRWFSQYKEFLCADSRKRTPFPISKIYLTTLFTFEFSWFFLLTSLLFSFIVLVPMEVKRVLRTDRRPKVQEVANSGLQEENKTET